MARRPQSTRHRGPARHRQRRRSARLTLVALVLLLVLVLAGPQYALWSGAPLSPKECVVSAVPSPVPWPATGSPARPAAASYTGLLEQRGGAVSDASCLTRTPVFGVVRARSVADVRAALAFAEEHDLAVSVAGTQHAMGGQASYPGGLVLDMRAFSQVTVDEDRRTATVQAGATWHQVLEAVHPVGLSVSTMPSVDVLSVGGTVSVNAHGLDFRAGSLSSTIRALRVMLADGRVHRVSREQQPDLFRAVVGGYGLFGVILEVELELVDSEMYRLRSRVVDYREFPDVFASDIAGDDSVRLTYTHLSTAPTSLLREAIVYSYERVDVAEPIPALRERSSDRFSRLVFNLARTGDLGQRLKWTAQRELLPRVRGCVQARNEALREAEACMVARNQAMYESLGFLQNRLPQYTDVLHEYFLPHDQLAPFLDELRAQLGTHDARLLSASIRSVDREDIVLDYAQGERFSLVLYLSQATSDAGNADMADLTRALVESSLDLGGTFYLPYQQHYTREQVQQAYPRLDEFFAIKRRYDPSARFRNSFLARYV
ncbi:FAD-binding oxidoreductase [Ornithinicoccus halotolerans]|uniref:FAD-binding oxidoreductase n=1 Tax=Ornithinicoccus halotolerans TaxID=1748220 RepID=UPI001294C673|nr:FAD-binding oxidoreductase [Ornithinicoccus halotolerans]